MKSFAGNYMQFLVEFRKHDLLGFVEEHERLFQEAKRTGDHADVTKAYYKVMGTLIESYYGPNWHFCPPDHRWQSREDATRSMHDSVTRLLQHSIGKKTLDVGCGIGGMMKDVALYSGGQVVGITIGQHEIDKANELFREAELDHLCTALQGDSSDMPFEDSQFDSAYAVYALKYFTDLHPVLSEVHRVLKPGGLFAVYDLVKSDKYDPNNPEHVKMIEYFEYECGMPALHSNTSMIKDAGDVGLELVSRMDISQAYPWYHYFVKNPFFPWLLGSEQVHALVGALEKVGFLPKGFARFNKTFITGNVLGLIKGGKMGILTGSTILVFRKSDSENP